MPPTPTPLQTPSQIFSLYRTCLREIRQLPHVYLQQFYRIKARDDIKRILSCRRPQIHNRRFKQMQKEVRNLEKANSGQVGAFQHVLGVAYGRKGKLKWELLEPLADQTSLPTPPPIIPGVEKSRPPVYSPALTALLTSPDARKARRAMRQGAWKASNVLPPRADPESELARLLGPFSKRREVNLQQRFFKKAWSTVHPPLEVQAEAESGCSPRPSTVQDFGLVDHIESIIGSAPPPPLTRKEMAQLQTTPSENQNQSQRHPSLWVRRRYRELLTRLPLLKPELPSPTNSTNTIDAQPTRYTAGLSPYAMGAKVPPTMRQIDEASLAWLQQADLTSTSKKKQK